MTGWRKRCATPCPCQTNIRVSHSCYLEKNHGSYTYKISYCMRKQKDTKMQSSTCSRLLHACSSNGSWRAAASVHTPNPKIARLSTAGHGRKRECTFKSGTASKYLQVKYWIQVKVDYRILPRTGSCRCRS